MLPQVLHQEALPDNSGRVAFLRGPLVLAGDLGPEQRGRTTGPVPVFVSDRPITEWLKPVADKPGTFRSDGVGHQHNGELKDVDLVPFYRLHHRTYAVYWDLYNSEGWNKKATEIATEQAKQRKLEAATTSLVPVGETEKEKEFNQQGEDSTVDRSLGRPARRGKRWFSFDLPADSTHPIALVVTYFEEERGKRSFDILLDGQRIGEQTIERSAPGSASGQFFDVEYKIPPELVSGKKRVTLRFQATGGNEIAGVYGIRLIRADGARQ